MTRELIAGALLALSARLGPWTDAGWRRSLVLRAVLEVAPSVLYERVVDTSGWSWRDVAQRGAGSAVVEVVLVRVRFP